MIRGRLHRHGGHKDRGGAGDEYVEIQPAELTGVFGSRLARDAGLTASLLVGLALALAGAVGLLSLTQTMLRP